MIIHQNIKKSKSKKPNAKQRKLRSDWEVLLKKYESKKTFSKTDHTLKYDLKIPEDRMPTKTKSVDTGGIASKVADRVYTGDKVIGIATLHKSNAVPVFSNEEAIDISRMRRG